MLGVHPQLTSLSPPPAPRHNRSVAYSHNHNFTTPPIHIYTMEQPPKGQLQLYPEYITNNPTVSISAAPVMYQRPNAADEEKKEAEVKLGI